MSKSNPFLTRSRQTLIWCRAATAESWFQSLQQEVHAMLDKHRDDEGMLKRSERAVKIAILDSGIAKSPAKGPIPVLMKSPRFKKGLQLDPSLPWNVDTKGHGTHAAGLIHRVCPYADIYVYRVVEGDETIDRKYVAQALAHAIDVEKVDIVSMSFGWKDDSDEELRAVIERARASKVLLFAATSNEGNRSRAGIAYPARATDVFGIDSANFHGKPSIFNPVDRSRGQRLTALGEVVKSAYPSDLPTEEPEPGSRRLSGTSSATPIAAGIAGLILEFARQPPLSKEPAIGSLLKHVDGMKLILTECCSQRSSDQSEFSHLNPTFLFHYDEDCEEGGDWTDTSSPRHEMAHDIVRRLRSHFGRTIGQEMKAPVNQEKLRRLLEGGDA